MAGPCYMEPRTKSCGAYPGLILTHIQMVTSSPNRRHLAGFWEDQFPLGTELANAVEGGKPFGSTQNGPTSPNTTWGGVGGVGVGLEWWSRVGRWTLEMGKAKIKRWSRFKICLASPQQTVNINHCHSHGADPISD